MRFLTTNSSKKDIVLKLITLLTLVLAVMMLPGCLGQKQEQVRKEMTAYLNERYGLEFVVGKPYLTGSGLTTHYEAVAYPKGQPEIKFKVGQDYNTGDPKKYVDYSYLLAKWAYQAQIEIAKKIRQVYGEGVDFRISCEYRFGDYTLKDLDFAEVFDKTRGNGSIYLHYALFVDGAQFNKKAEAEKAYEIMKPFVLDYGGTHYTFITVYIDKTFKQEFLEIRYNYQSDRELSKLFKEKKLLGYLRVNPTVSEHIEINDGNDLAEFFEY